MRLQTVQIRSKKKKKRKIEILPDDGAQVNKTKKGIKRTKIGSVITNDQAHDETIEHVNAVNLDNTKPSEPVTTNNDIDDEGDNEENIVTDEVSKPNSSANKNKRIKPLSRRNQPSTEKIKIPIASHEIKTEERDETSNLDNGVSHTNGIQPSKPKKKKNRKEKPKVSTERFEGVEDEVGKDGVLDKIKPVEDAGSAKKTKRKPKKLKREVKVDEPVEEVDIEVGNDDISQVEMVVKIEQTPDEENNIKGKKMKKRDAKPEPVEEVDNEDGNDDISQGEIVDEIENRIPTGIKDKKTKKKKREANYKVGNEGKKKKKSKSKRNKRKHKLVEEVDNEDLNDDISQGEMVDKDRMPDEEVDNVDVNDDISQGEMMDEDQRKKNEHKPVEDLDNEDVNDDISQVEMVDEDRMSDVEKNSKKKKPEPVEKVDHEDINDDISQGEMVDEDQMPDEEKGRSEISKSDESADPSLSIKSDSDSEDSLYKNNESETIENKQPEATVASKTADEGLVDTGIENKQKVYCISQDQLDTESKNFFLPIMSKMRIAIEKNDANAAKRQLGRIQANVAKVAPLIIKKHRMGMLVKDTKDKFIDNEDLQMLAKSVTRLIKKEYHKKMKILKDDVSAQKIIVDNDAEPAPEVEITVADTPVKKEPPSVALVVPRKHGTSPKSIKLESPTAWLTGHIPTDTSYKNDGERTFAMEFFVMAVEVFSKQKDMNPKSIARGLEAATFKLHERDMRKYWEKVHAVCAAIVGQDDKTGDTWFAGQIMKRKYVTASAIIRLPLERLYEYFEGRIT